MWLTLVVRMAICISPGLDHASWTIPVPTAARPGSLFTPPTERKMTCLKMISASMIFVLTSCGGAEPASREASDPVADAAALAAPSFESVLLSASDVEHFIAATKEFQALGMRIEKNLGGNPSAPAEVVQGLSANADAMAILKRHGFDVVRYQQVGMSVMMSAAALEMERSSGGTDPMAEIEKMKAQLPPEQYEAMKKMTETSMSAMQSVKSQPEGNLVLARKYRDQIEALGK